MNLNFTHNNHIIRTQLSIVKNFYRDMVELMILTKVNFPGKVNRITVQYLVFKNYLLPLKTYCKKSEKNSSM